MMVTACVTGVTAGNEIGNVLINCLSKTHLKRFYQIITWTLQRHFFWIGSARVNAKRLQTGIMFRLYFSG